MSDTVYVVTEKYPTGGISGISTSIFKKEKDAISHFKQLIVNNMDPDVKVSKKVIDNAVKERHWSTCEGDYDQEIVIQVGEVVVA